MIAPVRAVCLVLALPVAAQSQRVSPEARVPAYRGFTPGIDYGSFVQRARPLADRDELRCQTSPRTAQVMECAVAIRDPADGAHFYLSAHFIEGNADMVAFYDSAGFGTRGGGVALVDRSRRDLTRIFGRPHALGTGAWQWRYGRRVVRLSWRGRSSARWVSITLTDNDVMDRIRKYVKKGASRKP